MILEVYAVHDAAVGAYNQPLFFRSRGEAIRSFQDAVADPSNRFGSHASDYSLWQLATYDDSNGVIGQLVQPQRVCGAKDFLLPDPGKTG